MEMCNKILDVLPEQPTQTSDEIQLKKNEQDADEKAQCLKNKEQAEAERLKSFDEKKSKNNPPFSYTQFKSEDGMTQLEVNSFADAALTEEQKARIQLATLCATTGSASEDFGRLMFTQSLTANFTSGYDHALVANAYNGALLSMKPQDEFEGMLCMRLLALHNQQMHYMAIAAHPKQNDVGIDLNINRATKLGRLYNETLDALNKHRRKGEQKVTVQHVNVEKGGQAIVTGELNQGGGDNDKK